ncbi:PAS domain-containing sensor histidine kinase [Dokdonia sp. 4H-3-7-5]|uniref:PAS domain-containing sensor histidine kinase n=1 Tax=Dokdonia sp. (strain 4H-3-7-5) TaxID=983548 RepID=UPI00020A6D7C|nr:PAS domain-containing sensor histidine kinase [Dokdonia sp. 4H-3-7-5]AEE19074.1 PAS/PAC sensor signal transduction histidine kinase [Dokdonia sp. 4H-3-7-5]
MNLSRLSLKGKKNATVEKNAASTSDYFSMDNFYYKQISELTGAGGWSVDFKNKKSFFDEQARNILNVPKDYKPTLNTGFNFYAEEHMDKATALFFDCAQGKSFSTHVKMRTYDGEIFWAKASGRPLRDNDKEIIGIRGVFQNIHEEKLREEQLEQSFRLIQGHNSRLYDFAHIISHNLRSQVGNLQMSAALFDSSNLSADQNELLQNFTKIGKSLDVTLRHLNKIVSVHSVASKTRDKVVIQDVYNRVVAGLLQTIRENKVVMYTDFSEVEEIPYIEAYLESILQNLITNAIRYKHPDRDPEISLYTYEENGKVHLLVKDNGLGIDLKKHGEELFKIYKTFHGNDDALGLGLFLTRNEVEAMGGEINVESKVGKGSKFIVTLD